MAELPPLPTDFSYSAEHEWVNATPDAIAGNTVTVGITAVAADALGDIIFVDLPSVGASVTGGQTCGEVEATKSVSDIYSPVTGEVVAVNEEATANPGVLNSDPYGAGWLFKVAATEAGPLVDAAAYGEANNV